MTNTVAFTENQRGQFGEVFQRLNTFKGAVNKLGATFEGQGYWDELYYIQNQLGILEFYLANVYKTGTGVDVVDGGGNFVGDGSFVPALSTTIGGLAGVGVAGGAIEQPTV